MNALRKIKHFITESMRPSGEMPPAERTHYYSRFGGLWTDRKDTPQLIEAKLARGEISQEMAERLRFWWENGYVIIPNAVPEADIDALNADINKAWDTLDARYLVQMSHGDYVQLPEVERNRILAKLLDVYWYSDAARRVSFSTKISEFLRTVFEDDVLAFQNLTFEVGSTQSVHQDTAYVVTSSPLAFAASWVAREDIEEGSGELVYYPGSHRFPDFIYGGKYKHWNPERDGQEVHQQFLKYLHEQAQMRGIALQKFRPKKGDALIWAADLAHGGGPIAYEGATRRSYVTHYCPKGETPHYFTFKPDHAKKVGVAKGCYISSMFYKPVGE